MKPAKKGLGMIAVNKPAGVKPSIRPVNTAGALAAAGRKSGVRVIPAGPKPAMTKKTAGRGR